MNISRILKVIISFVIFNAIVFSQDYKVEVGIESIVKDNDKYNISVYIINPYIPIAGIQFKIIPSDIFIVENIYEGKAIDAGFQIHKNPKGTILGFSMEGSTIPAATITVGPNRFKDNIALEIIATSDNIPKDTLLKMECVMASKGGESLSTKFIPFDLSDIVYVKD
tara:strand:+ start:437 stop:937 length:501 start_codon:yes stop_codon:yes gene_type:complete